MSPLFDIWHSIQHTLFPWLENELDPLTEKQQEFVRVIELVEVQKHSGKRHFEFGLAA